MAKCSVEDLCPAFGTVLKYAWIALITAYCAAIYGFLVVVEYKLWRGVGETVTQNVVVVFPLFSTPRTLTPNAWMIVMVLTTGALGSFIHAATSLADFVGNKRAESSWMVWYLLRPLIGSALAFVLYLLMRGGFLTPVGGSGNGAPATAFNIYGFAGLAALSGLFAKQATDKLGEVFDAFFRTKAGQGDDSRSNPLVPAAPRIASLMPPTLAHGAANMTIAVNGSDFNAATTRARVNGQDRATTVASATHLTFVLLPADVAAPGTLQVTVFSSAAGGGVSNELPLTIT